MQKCTWRRACIVCMHACMHTPCFGLSAMLGHQQAQITNIMYYNNMILQHYRTHSYHNQYHNPKFTILNHRHNITLVIANLLLR